MYHCKNRFRIRSTLTTDPAQLAAAVELGLFKEGAYLLGTCRCISQCDVQREWPSLVHLDSWLSGSWLKALYHVPQIDAKRMVISITWHFGN